MRAFRSRRCIGVMALLVLLVISADHPAAAGIYRWDNGELITEMEARKFVDYSGMDLSYAQFVNAQLLRALFSDCDLTSELLT